MDELTDALVRAPLRPGQRVLALTFMHGSRRRLDARLRAVAGLWPRYECSTIDSFAWRIVRRWRALVERRRGFTMPSETEYDRVCDLAGELLEHEPVVGWVAAAFPIVLVDEAQDLTVERLRIVRALAARLDSLVAADEFQCLNEMLRPNPFTAWIACTTEAETLETPHRTDVPDLLDAAASLRRGSGPRPGKNFKISVTPTVPFAGNYVSNQIAWYRRGGTVAVITPSARQFATSVVDWVGAKTSKRGNGPYRIVWERAEKEILDDLLAQLAIEDSVAIAAAAVVVGALEVPHVVRYVRGWLDTQRRVLGRSQVARHEVEAAVERALAQRRRIGRGEGSALAAMTVHTAKNREFDGVIVLWPYAVTGGAEQRRRLLYTAITRAKRWCQVLVQGSDVRTQAPFA